MTRFQSEIIDQLRQAAAKCGLALQFEEKLGQATSRFEWRGKEKLLIVSDGELILEWDGEHYFESPTEPNHAVVRQFVEQFKLCLEGATAREARRLAKLHVGHAG